MEVKELTDDATGNWLVETETSSYLIDMDRHRAMRIPGAGAGIHPDHAENRIVVVSKLEGDNDWFDFAAIKYCAVGDPMLVYEGSARGMRRSTVVCRIRKVHPND